MKNLIRAFTHQLKCEIIELNVQIDHVHFLVQSVPTMRVSEIVAIIKSITAKKIFKKHKEVKKILWGGNLWTSEYYANTVGRYASKDAIIKLYSNPRQ